jgi:hypothetical protein
MVGRKALGPARVLQPHSRSMASFACFRRMTKRWQLVDGTVFEQLRWALAAR